MTQKPTFTLTITNGNQGRMAATEAVQPKAENANRPEDRIMARAKLAATYAGLLGVTTAPRDIFDVVAAAPQHGNDPHVEAEALRSEEHTSELQSPD